MTLNRVPPEVWEAMEDIALGIFTDMVNSGATLQQTLASIYLSGMENALSALKEGAGMTDLKQALLDFIEEFRGSQQDRHPMFSEGYDLALFHVEQLIEGESWLKTPKE
jgi:hypothetical protein